MKDFIKVFFLILGALGFYLILALIGRVFNPFLLSLIGIIGATAIILYGIFFWRRGKGH